MTKQEYRFIRNLAWDLLIDANISQLPVDISAIAAIYDLQHLVDYSKTLYDNALSVSEGILEVFGLANHELKKNLAVRILAPMIVFKELGIKSPEEMGKLSGLPADLAKQRFERFERLLTRSAFETSRLESIVLSQFREWLGSR